MLVNLNTGGSKKNYLKIAISLELTSESDSVALENLLPRVVDNFQVYLRELRVEDLRGSAGVQRLREELLLRVKKAVHPIERSEERRGGKGGVSPCSSRWLRDP